MTAWLASSHRALCSRCCARLATASLLTLRTALPRNNASDVVPEPPACRCTRHLLRQTLLQPANLTIRSNVFLLLAVSLFIFRSVCLSVTLCLCLPARLSVYACVCTHTCNHSLARTTQKSIKYLRGGCYIFFSVWLVSHLSALPRLHPFLCLRLHPFLCLRLHPFLCLRPQTCGRKRPQD